MRMTTSRESLAEKYFKQSWKRLPERERRVLEAIGSRLRISRPIQREMAENLTLGERFADRVAAFGGSWTFIALFFVMLLSWMALNVVTLISAWDPYPFILLNLVLSCLAAVQAPVILMSQNRAAAKDRERAAHDYEVNLKAEIEIMQLHDRLEELRTHDVDQVVKLQQETLRLIEGLVRDGGSRC